MNIVTNNKIYLYTKYILKILLRGLTNHIKLVPFGQSNNQINKIFIINLDRQVDRWNLIKKELRRLLTVNNKSLLDFSERFSAIDAIKTKNKNDNLGKVRSSYKIHAQFYVDPDPQLLNIIREEDIDIKLTREETAIALSHISIWKKIVSKNIPYAVILEDDVYFEPNFAKKLNACWNEITESNIKFDLLFLSYKKVNYNPEIRKISKNLSIPIRGIWWFSGYVLSNNGAKKILDKLPVIGPVDLWINHQFKNLKVYLTNQPIINQKLHITSDNKYSILPILSQIGIKSDKTFINLDKLKGLNPVFIFDLRKNSQNVLINLNTLLNLNSYKTYYNQSSEDSMYIESQIKNNKMLLFDAYLGFDQIIPNLIMLINFYPSSVFIFINDETSINNDYSQFSKYDRKRILLLDSQTSDIYRQVSKFLQIKYWDLSNYKTNADYKEKRMNTHKVDVQNKYKYLEHDVNPWILPLRNIKNFLPYDYKIDEISPIGEPINVRYDPFSQIDLDFWEILDNTFPSNLAYFSKNNFRILENSGFEINITNTPYKGKRFTSSSIVSKRKYKYGCFEITMKPAKGDGIISAFFLHRNDPWQEIDVEFLGNDTTKILLNVYFNPGIENTKNNYGVKGTPILIELGFDASEDFHTYKIEWEFHEIRWYVDNKLIHIRKMWTPSPIPNLHMPIYINTWITGTASLAGEFNDKILPKNIIVKSINIFKFNYSD